MITIFTVGEGCLPLLNMMRCSHQRRGIGFRCGTAVAIAAGQRGQQVVGWPTDQSTPDAREEQGHAVEKGTNVVHESLPITWESHRFRNDSSR